MFEKKRGKRFLASVMALVMLLSLAPVGALATEEQPQTTEEPTVVQPAEEGKDQQDVVDEDKNTPTEPTKDSDSAEATKLEGDLDEGYSNADTSDNDNGIAAQNVSDGRTAEEQTITAEYWVTNAEVRVDGNNSMTISQNYTGITSNDGVSVESLAPETGTQGGNTAIFWQARVLPYGYHQTDGGGVNRTSNGTEIQRIKYNSNSEKFQYQAKDSDTWNDINTTYWKDQLVFYYLIKTDFAKNIQINVSDWPVSKRPTDRPEYRQLRYEVWVKNADGSVAGTTPIDSKNTYYYSGVNISDIQVRMNDLSQYKIESIDISDSYSDPTVDSNGAGSDFGLDLGQVSATDTVTIKIYVTPYKYTVTYTLDGKQYEDVTSYEPGQSVTVKDKPTQIGYNFEGWTTSDATIKDGTFEMPAKNVELTGSWAKNNYNYTIEYYYDGMKDDSQTETKSAAYGSEIKNYPDKSRTGYKLAKTENLPLTISDKAADNVIRVYYVKDEVKNTINQHFMDGKGQERDDLRVKGDAQMKPKGTPLSDLIEGMTGTQPKGDKNYVYVSSKTTYTVDKETKPLTGEPKLTGDTTIDLYYYLDETGKTDEKGKDTNKPNNYPDAWEYKATFIVKNGQWDTNPTGGSDTIVKYLPTKKITTGESIPAKLSNVPTAGNTPDSHYKAGSWDPKPKEGAVITKDMTYTYTYSWRSSGGSGGSNRPKPPVVEIPDDVPTGLNGKDHYAYIIGYGNNDVRPQNNITRAEVATIFFRLLTDETREANMTKSNSYNDVKDGDWFCCAVSTLSKMGIIKGYEDGSFKPDQKITRAETMTLVNRVLNRLPEAKDDLHKDMKTWVDNMDETAWYYLAVQEATNSHYFKNKTGTKFEQWTDLRDTRDWSELEK